MYSATALEADWSLCLSLLLTKRFPGLAWSASHPATCLSPAVFAWILIFVSRSASSSIRLILPTWRPFLLHQSYAISWGLLCYSADSEFSPPRLPIVLALVQVCHRCPLARHPVSRWYFWPVRTFAHSSRQRPTSHAAAPSSSCYRCAKPGDHFECGQSPAACLRWSSQVFEVAACSMLLSLSRSLQCLLHCPWSQPAVSVHCSSLFRVVDGRAGFVPSLHVFVFPPQTFNGNDGSKGVIGCPFLYCQLDWKWDLNSSPHLS